MLNFKKHLPLLVVIGSCILVFAFLNDKEDYVDEYNAKIKALEAKVDSLHSENEGLNNNILFYKSEDCLKEVSPYQYYLSNDP